MFLLDRTPIRSQRFQLVDGCSDALHRHPQPFFGKGYGFVFAWVEEDGIARPRLAAKLFDEALPLSLENGYRTFIEIDDPCVPSPNDHLRIGLPLRHFVHPFR